MPRARLTQHVEEPVSILAAQPGSAGRFGEGKVTYAPAPNTSPILANVQPLGVADAEAYGLPSKTEYHQAFLPLAFVALPERVEYRGHQYKVVKAERWQSYTALVLERV